jgi:hypothetical protein
LHRCGPGIKDGRAASAGCSERRGLANHSEDQRTWFDRALKDAKIKGFTGMTYAIRLRVDSDNKARSWEDIAEALGYKS